MKLFNTLSRTTEEVIPFKDKLLGLYACGLTVYDFTHVGHLRKYTMDDVLVRTLRHAGFTVNHVQNVTDVGHLVSDADEGEDKMEKGSRKYGKSVWELAKEFEDYYWKSMRAMNNLKPDVICRATEHIKEQIELVQILEKKEFTYTLDDGIYFDSSKFPSYGELAKLNAEGLKEGARVEPVKGKRSPTDFALWKFSPAGEQRQMEWASPWGKGFPGWHIECSAMSMRYLGDQFEIHTGGIDHIPVHHTNEIAQSEAATGKHPFVKYWVHHNMLLVDNTKMSKSLGNFYTINDVIKRGFSPMALRLLFLNAHYRSSLNFTWESLASMQTAWEKLLTFLVSFKNEKERTTISNEKLDKVDEYRKQFFEHMENDLDTPKAHAIMWEVVKSNVPGRDKYDLIQEFDEVLGFDLAKHVATVEQKPVTAIPDEIRALAEQRLRSRQQGHFEQADTYRSQLKEQGWTVEDTADGYTLKKIVV